MARFGAPRENAFPDLQASVVVSVRGRTLREAVMRSVILTRGRAVAVSVALVIMTAVILVLLRQDHRVDGASAAIAAQLREPGSAGVAAAYRYPLSCLSVEFASRNRSFARARLDRASPCWRYRVWVTAIFHRKGGIWRRVFDSAGYTCPVRSIPRAVERQLGVCP